jgi:cytochrome c oxidase subunit 3
MLFVAGQMWGWEQMAGRGLFSDPWGARTSSFLDAMVELHTLHVLAGLVALGLCLGTLGWLRRVELRQIAVDTTAWYWHTMSVVWLMLVLVQVLGR